MDQICFIALLKYVAQRNSLMTKLLKSKLSCPGTDILIVLVNSLLKCFDTNIPKVWIRIPYLGSQEENLLNSCLKKIRCLKQPVKFIVVYNTRKVSFYLSQNNVVYQITCPGCAKSYIGKTNHCLQKHLLEHAVAQHFLQCDNAHFIVDLCKRCSFSFSHYFVRAQFHF